MTRFLPCIICALLMCAHNLERVHAQDPNGAAPQADVVLSDDGITSPAADAEQFVLPPMPSPEELIDQAMQPLLLRDAIVRALENNTQLAVQRLSPAIREAGILSAKGPFDLIIAGGVTYSRSTTQTVADPSLLLAGQAFDATNRSLDGELSLTKEWATGTVTGVNIAGAKSSPSGGMHDYSSSAAFSIRQSLLRGMRPAANLAGIHQAENSWMSSRYQLRAQTITTVANVEKTYWNLALAYALLAVQKFSLRLAETQEERTQAFVDVGLVSELELTNAQAEAASRRQDFIQARNNLETTAIDMLLLIEPELPDSGQYALPRPSDQVQMPILPSSDAESLRLGLANRPDLFQAHLDLDNGELDVIRTKDGLLPRLDLVGSYGVTGRGLEFHDSRERARDADFDNYSIGGEFEIPLPNRSARGQYRAAKTTREQLELSIVNLRQQIKGNVLKARIDLANQIDSVEAARATVTLQEERLRNEDAKWRNGLSTLIDVFQVQRDLITSRNQLLQGIANALISETNLYVQEGTLLEVRGISAEGGEELK